SVSGQRSAASVERRCGRSETARYASSAVAFRVSVSIDLRPTSTRGAPRSDTLNRVIRVRLLRLQLRRVLLEAGDDALEDDALGLDPLRERGCLPQALGHEPPCR